VLKYVFKIWQLLWRELNHGTSVVFFVPASDIRKCGAKRIFSFLNIKFLAFA